MIDKIRQKLCEWFAIDLRTLAFFRICLALVLLYDLAWRSTDLVVHYTNQGILPKADLLSHPTYQHSWSLLFLTDTPLGVTILFICYAAILIFLLAGYRTQLFTVLAWLFFVSIEARNPVISSNADTLMRVTLFWAMFLPLGKRWSVDALRNRPIITDNACCSMATVAVCIQFLFVYFFAWFTKTGAEWWPEGSAIYYALQSNMGTPVGKWLVQAPFEWLQMLTFIIYWAELLVFYLFFISRWRMMLFVFIFVIQIGFAWTLEVGLFPLASIVAALILIPGTFWDRWQGHDIPKDGEAHQVVYSPTLAALRNGFVVACLILVTAWNFRLVSDPLKTVVKFLRLDQRWSMFAPYPIRNSGPFTVEGQIGNRSVFSLPCAGHGLFRENIQAPDCSWNHRWIKYYEILKRDDVQEFTRAYLTYICREWNQRHSRVDKMSLVYVGRKNVPYAFMQEPKKIYRLGQATCP